MNDGAHCETTLSSLPERRKMDGSRVQKACSAILREAHIPQRLPEIPAGGNSLICMNYGERQFVKTYAKFGKTGSLIVLSHKLSS